MDSSSNAPSAMSYLTPGGAIDNLIEHPIDTVSTAYDEASTVAKTVNTVLTMSVGDYTLVAVGIILAIGALLISQKTTVVQVASNASKAAAAVA